MSSRLRAGGNEVTFGADEVIDRTRERFDEVAGEVDLVFDTAGGDRLERSPAVLRPGGRLVSIAEEPPADAGSIQGDEFLARRRSNPYRRSSER